MANVCIAVSALAEVTTLKIAIDAIVTFKRLWRNT